MAETRWQGFTHEELYRLLNEGAGPAASAEPSRRWAEISATLTEVGQDLRQAVGSSGAAWSGPAASAAQDRLAGLVDWAAQTGAHAGEMRKLVEDQAEHLARARAEMPVPEDTKAATPDPTAAPAVQVLTSQQDQEPVESAASTGAQRAFEVMAAYQRDTSTNTGAMASFATPAELAAPGEVHRRQGAGVQTTTPNVSVGVAAPPVQRDHDQDHGRGQGHHRGGGEGRWGGGWGPTTGAGTDAPAIRRPLTPSPGSYTGAAPIGQPLFGPAPLGSTTGDDDPGRSGSSRRGVVPTTAGPGTTGGLGTPSVGTSLTGTGAGAPGFDLQSAAAGQAAAAAPGSPAAAAPGVAAGTNSADAKGGLRRFGVETIGTGQWFGDPPDTELNSRPAARGRWASREDERVTEQVNIDGENHNLPPTVIGEGPT